ncbi:MAG: outer membrane lipoprotein-sorting protein [Bryobacteraceae bacterium]|nr:outer membrane lipoprotein-sorting protein [Bryobacteraceae bacterium]
MGSSVGVLSLAMVGLLHAQSFSAPVKPDPARDLLERYWEQEKARVPLTNVAMDCEIEASVPKWKKSSKMTALRLISKVGRVTYQKLTFTGDDQVKRDVIARFLTAETEAHAQTGDISLTPANYKFNFKGRIEQDGKVAYIFQLSPKEKRVGLFKGDLWLDAETGLPLRESGRLVKNPSVFFKKTEFTRKYEIRDGHAYLTEWESLIDARVVGRVEMAVKYSNYQSAVENEAVAEK